MKNHLKTILFFVSFFYLTLYPPVFWTLYFPHWYTVNCHFNERCKRVGPEKVRQGIHELVAFYRHTADSLPSYFWTPKEKSHLGDVRQMTDHLFFTALVALVLFGVCFDRSRLRRFSRVNLIAVLSLIAILPVFPFFWRHIFHPLLFTTNRNWLNTPKDFSFYILPRVFFRNTVILLIVYASLFNITSFFLSGRSPGPKNKANLEP